MRISKIVLGILDAMITDGTIAERIYATPAKTNVSMSKAKMPCAVVYCITDSTIDMNKRLDRESAQIFASFHVRQKNLAFDGEQNDELIDQTKEMAMEFMSRVMSSDKVSVVGDTVHVRPFYNANDTNTTGVTVEIQLRENGGACI